MIIFSVKDDDSKGKQTNFKGIGEATLDVLKQCPNLYGPPSKYSQDVQKELPIMYGSKKPKQEGRIVIKISGETKKCVVFVSKPFHAWKMCLDLLQSHLNLKK